MGFWMALLYDRTMRRAEEACLRSWRRELLAQTRGDVLELGAGTGLNLPFYPVAAIQQLVLAEPDRHMRARLERRVRGFDLAGVEVSKAGADTLPFPDSSFDSVVSTLVLCTVPDPDATLAEVRRVLRPGGSLRFLEHVADECGARRSRWQRRIEPAWRWLAEGCRLTRRTEQTIEAAGFVIEQITREEMRPVPAWVGPTIRGVAIDPLPP